jgi:hypothetical protein
MAGTPIVLRPRQAQIFRGGLSKSAGRSQDGDDGDRDSAKAERRVWTCGATARHFNDLLVLIVDPPAKAGATWLKPT